MLNVFEFTDYRAYLKSYYELHKKLDSGFSYASMAERAKVSSRGLLKLIVDGKRNLSISNLHNISTGLGLNKSESQYFSTLVQFNQTKNLEEKNKLYELMLKFPQARRVQTLRQELHNFYSKWYFAVLLEMTHLIDAPSDREAFCAWASARLSQRVSAREISTACAQLISLGLLKEDEASGKLVVANQFTKTDPGEVNFALQNFHRHMIQEAVASLPKPIEERIFGGVTLAIRREDLPKAKAFINEFKAKFNFDFSAGEGAETVYQLNLQFFELADGNSPSTESRQTLNSAIETPAESAEMSSTPYQVSQEIS